MRGRFANTIAAASLLICAATCVLWRRSYSAFDEIRTTIRQDGWAPVPVRTFYIRFVRGCIELGTTKEQRFEYRDWQPAILHHDVRYFTVHPARRILVAGSRRMYGGFGAIHDCPPEEWSNLPRSHIEEIVAMWAPSWFVPLISALLPARWGYVWMREKKRKRRGLCTQCGYDLRGSREICPECGRAIARTTGETPVPQSTETS